MPTASVNGIDINYRLDGDGERTVVLVNGLADDLETWVLQMEDLLGAGYRVLRFDNRGVGRSSAPAGPYTTKLFAEDAKALVDELGLRDFHLVGVSMGGMIAQEYAIAYGGDLRSLTLGCTYAEPGPFCSRMFAMWADMAPELGIPFVMRDVTLRAVTPASGSTRRSSTGRCSNSSTPTGAEREGEGDGRRGTFADRRALPECGGRAHQPPRASRPARARGRCGGGRRCVRRRARLA